jgi:hypothetical protein
MELAYIDYLNEKIKLKKKITEIKLRCIKYIKKYKHINKPINITETTKAQLIWIQNKARPMWLCDSRRDYENAKHAVINSNEFKDVLYSEEFIRYLSSKKPHYFHIFYHKDNENKIKEQLEKIKKRYSLETVGEMLGYLTPTAFEYRSNRYNNNTTNGSLQWYINKEMAFSEQISNFNSLEDKIKEKYNLLKQYLPPSLKLELKIWKQESKLYDQA